MVLHMHTHRQLLVHKQTAAHITHVPTPTCMTAPIVEQFHMLVQQLYDENDSLKHQVAALTTCCNDLTYQLSNMSQQLLQLTTAPRLRKMIMIMRKMIMCHHKV